MLKGRGRESPSWRMNCRVHTSQMCRCRKSKFSDDDGDDDDDDDDDGDDEGGRCFTHHIPSHARTKNSSPACNCICDMKIKTSGFSF